MTIQPHFSLTALVTVISLAIACGSSAESGPMVGQNQGQPQGAAGEKAAMLVPTSTQSGSAASGTALVDTPPQLADGGRAVNITPTPVIVQGAKQSQAAANSAVTTLIPTVGKLDSPTPVSLAVKVRPPAVAGGGKAAGVVPSATPEPTVSALAPAPTGSPQAIGELPPTGTGVGDLAPAYSMALADGATVTSEDITRAGKPVFLMFTVTW